MNELIESTAKREVLEETGINLSLSEGKVFMVSEWTANNNGENVQILGIFFRYDIANIPEIKLSNEHDNFAWINTSNLVDLDVNKEIPEILKILGI